jgi:hypothetical protein
VVFGAANVGAKLYVVSPHQARPVIHELLLARVLQELPRSCPV